MNVYTKAKQRVIEMQIATKELNNLQQQLRALGPVPQDISVLDFAILYFDIIVRFQDKNVLTNNVVRTSKTLSKLALHIDNSGRNPGGIVRAKRGEQITGNNLFLGNTGGYWTFTINRWKEYFTKEGRKDENGPHIIANQVRNVIETDLPQIIKLIDIINTEQAISNATTMEKIAKFFNRTK